MALENVDDDGNARLQTAECRDPTRDFLVAMRSMAT
jgi:hypothetical protein